MHRILSTGSAERMMRKCRGASLVREPGDPNLTLHVSPFDILTALSPVEGRESRDVRKRGCRVTQVVPFTHVALSASPDTRHVAYILLCRLRHHRLMQLIGHTESEKPSCFLFKSIQP